MPQIITLRAQAGFTGFESPAKEYTQKELRQEDLLVDDPDATFTYLAEGDSMTGDSIYSGDLLIVCRAARVMDCDIVVANLNGVFICKRIDIKNRVSIASGGNVEDYRIQECIGNLSKMWIEN